MNSLVQHLGISLRLHFRNPMGLFYGFLFPLLFLIAFAVLYRFDQVPLVRHIGVLLTITALGGACFGLPTTMVGERERGVWRRFRLTPVGTGTLVGSTVLARYLLLLVAGLLQLLLAMAIGMPVPQHLFDLWLAFTFVCFAFLGMGLVIAMLADNVPAVQALGQCIFLPMLILGGVAVPIESLPDWAQRLSHFFPGIYAVEAIQATVTGPGLGAARFQLLALLLIGIAGSVAGAKLFRWDAQQRFTNLDGKRWVTAALAGWLAVGVMNETGAATAIAGTPPEEPAGARTVAFGSGPIFEPTLSPEEAAAIARRERAGDDAEEPAEGDALEDVTTDPADPEPSDPEPAPPATAETPRETGVETPTRDRPRAAVEDRPAPAPTPATPEPQPTPPPAPEPSSPAAPWRTVTLEDIDRDIDFTRLPPDGGVITPIARSNAQPPQWVAEQMECMRQYLPEWEPGHVQDPVQRARNLLDLIALPDLLQMEAIESMVPHVVFERLQTIYPRDELIQIMYWIAMNPYEGEEPQLDRLSRVCIQADGRVNLDDLRVRTSIYAAKLLGRLTGHITPR